jgi:hypothetical protein
VQLGSTPDCPDKYPRNAIVMTTQAVPGWSAKLPRFGSLRFDRYPPTLGKHSATHRSNLGTHIRAALPRCFSDLAVFDARLYVPVRRIDEPA